LKPITQLGKRRQAAYPNPILPTKGITTLAWQGAHCIYEEIPIIRDELEKEPVFPPEHGKA
jgi:hypothetical protein